VPYPPSRTSSHPPRSVAIMVALKSAFLRLWAEYTWFRTAVVIAAFAAPWLLLAVTRPTRSPAGVIVDLAALSFVAAAIVHAAWDGFRASRVKARGVLTFIAIVNLAAAEFAYYYWSVSQHNRDAFSEPLDRADAAYLSVATLTTVDPGDLAPLSAGARIVAAGQMGFGVAALVVGLTSIIGASTRRSGS
jgi:hypothetical protein